MSVKRYSKQQMATNRNGLQSHIPSSGPTASLSANAWDVRPTLQSQEHIPFYHSTSPKPHTYFRHLTLFSPPQTSSLAKQWPYKSEAQTSRRSTQRFSKQD